MNPVKSMTEKNYRWVPALSVPTGLILFYAFSFQPIASFLPSTKSA